MSAKENPGSGLQELGWSTYFSEQLVKVSRADWIPARVFLHRIDNYQVFSARGEFTARVAGKLRHGAALSSKLPVVGDWVALDLTAEDTPIIRIVLPRKSSVSRKIAGGRKKMSGGEVEEQVIAANIDTIFIVVGLDRDFNVRRLERYLTLVYNSGAAPVFVLNKADLYDDVQSYIIQVEAISFGVPIHAVSAVSGQGLEQLSPYFATGKTVALLGSSGAGKSTLINKLLGENRQAINPISESIGKGVHTTTHRELIFVPGGGIIMDNPGMREIQLWGDEEDLKETFRDIEEYARLCRFTDCQHLSEPDCAVKLAIENGDLEPKRLESYNKLKRELEYLEKRRYMSANRIDKERWMKIMKKK